MSSLLRWDGKSWSNLRNQNIAKIQFSSDGELIALINTEKINGKLFKFDNKEWTALTGVGISDFTVTDNDQIYALKLNDADEKCFSKWNGEGWDRYKRNDLTKIESHADIVYTLTNDNKIFQFSEVSWKRIPGSDITDFSLSKQGELFVINKTKSGNCFVNILQDNKLQRIAGSRGICKIQIGDTNNLYGMSMDEKKEGRVIKFEDGKWKTLPGRNIKDMALGSDNSLWVIKDSDKVKGKIYKWEEGKWNSIPGRNRTSLQVAENNTVFVF